MHPTNPLHPVQQLFYNRRMNLEQWRKIQGLTNNRLADMVGVNKSTISRLRRGVTKPSPDTAKAIVELTDGAVTLGDLYGGNLRKKEKA